MVEKNVITNQQDFEDAFAQGSGEINLAPGFYKVPHPDSAKAIYTFSGSIKGIDNDNKDAAVYLIGELGTEDSLSLKNLTMVNNQQINLSVLKGATATVDHVIFIRDLDSATPALEQTAIGCAPDSQLFLNSSEIYYRYFGGVIKLTDNVSAVIKNSRLMVLNLPEASYGNLVLNQVAVGEFCVNGKWNIVSHDLHLYTHEDGNYLRYPEGNDQQGEFSDKQCLFYLQNSRLLADQLQFPSDLPAKLVPVVAHHSQLFGSVVKTKLTYRPWIEALDSQVSVQNCSVTGQEAQEDNYTTERSGSSSSQSTSSPHDDHAALKKLKQLIGLSRVKEQVNTFIQMALMNKRRKERGMKTVASSFHSLFEGNPGTGKTTVARLVGKIMFEEGILPTAKYVEVDRTQLVAGYVGQTAKQTHKVLEEATGGMLFIDEAYDLVHGSDDTFGREALDTIMKYMEDHREELMIIFAGYTADMKKLLQQNPGMASRVPNVFTFEDYSADEIVAIGRLQLQQQQMHFDSPRTEKLYDQLVSEQYQSSNDHSNGRWIRNRNDQLLRQIAVATGQNTDHPLDEVWADDIQRAFGSQGNNGVNGQQESSSLSQGMASENLKRDTLFGNSSTLPLLNGDELK
ncbi:AAA family ATPase [uncultured Limosilactobacillus sp.]|uniref:AAA family ATPase n=1 Tax=uncultured Limosilactobacillus sp. TaxID=2837629 RepID=UPI0025E5FB1C|nr:AAA family ATPase [uncultured Limosilactobacillus sp.]